MRFRTNMATRQGPTTSNTMLLKKKNHSVFLAGATAPLPSPSLPFPPPHPMWMWMLLFVDLCSQKSYQRHWTSIFMHTRHLPRSKSRRPLQTEFPVFWEFLGIPRNSQKFPTMQITFYLKSLELLGISGKGRLQFCEDLEFLGILSNTNYLLFKNGGILGNFWELNLRQFKYPEVHINSKKFSIPWMWRF